MFERYGQFIHGYLTDPMSFFGWVKFDIIPYPIYVEIIFRPCIRSKCLRLLVRR